jgi:hypothetical protein
LPCNPDGICKRTICGVNLINIKFSIILYFLIRKEAEITIDCNNPEVLRLRPGGI